LTTGAHPQAATGLILLVWSLRESSCGKVGRSNRLGRASESRAASGPAAYINGPRKPPSTPGKILTWQYQEIRFRRVAYI